MKCPFCKDKSVETNEQIFDLHRKLAFQEHMCKLLEGQLKEAFEAGRRWRDDLRAEGFRLKSDADRYPFGPVTWSKWPYGHTAWSTIHTIPIALESDRRREVEELKAEQEALINQVRLSFGVTPLVSGCRESGFVVRFLCAEGKEPVASSVMRQENADLKAKVEQLEAQVATQARDCKRWHMTADALLDRWIAAKQAKE